MDGGRQLTHAWFRARPRSARPRDLNINATVLKSELWLPKKKPQPPQVSDRPRHSNIRLPLRLRHFNKFNAATPTDFMVETNFVPLAAKLKTKLPGSGLGKPPFVFDLLNAENDQTEP